ncbi:Uncharacterised protein [Chlamydia trachomatis]|nr:Uncharacterised protein [Chlamydia trachomatis]
MNYTPKTTTTSSYSSTATGSEASAKAWIASKESGGSYSARNGQYVGKYQLSSSYLNGDYSAANQERVADTKIDLLKFHLQQTKTTTRNDPYRVK